MCISTMVFRFNVIVVRFNVFQVAVSDFFRLTDKKQTQLRKGVVLKHSNCARARVRVCVCVCVRARVRACERACARAREQSCASTSSPCLGESPFCTFTIPWSTGTLKRTFIRGYLNELLKVY